MEGENAELVRRLFEVFNAGGDLVDIYFTDESQIWPAAGFPAGGPYRGKEEARRFFDGLREGWDPDMRVTIHEIEESGDVVVAGFEWRGVGEASGIEASSEWWVLYTFRSGRVDEVRYFGSRDEAHAAAGFD